MSYPAASYENYMVPALFGPWALRLIQSANPQPDERVLDVACGTGIVARSIAPYIGTNGNVTGLELNPDMLTVARSIAGREGHSFEWRQGQAEKLPFPNESFDLVVCQFALMFFADQRLALAEMRRVLTSGGRIVLSVWQGLDRHSFYQALHNVSLQRLGRSVVEQVFSLGNADELRGLLINAGFQHIEIEPMSLTARFPNPDEFLAWEMDVDPATVPAMRHLDDHARQALMDSIRVEMDAILREVSEADHVVMPFHAFMVCGQ
jgi:ubiquinone/menaquinone biosynthesis C-methylase UbiE